MNHDDLNVIAQLAGIKRIYEFDGDTGTGSQPPTKDPNTPTTFIPTHYHATITGGKDPLMMTKPGEFWVKTRDGITRFVPKGWDVEAVTKPGFDQRLSVDGEIDADGNFRKYGKGNTWVTAVNSSESTWSPARVTGAYPSAASGTSSGATNAPPAAPAGGDSPAPVATTSQVATTVPVATTSRIDPSDNPNPNPIITANQISGTSSGVEPAGGASAGGTTTADRPQSAPTTTTTTSPGSQRVPVGTTDQTMFDRVKYLMNKRR